MRKKRIFWQHFKCRDVLWRDLPFFSNTTELHSFFDLIFLRDKNLFLHKSDVENPIKMIKAILARKGYSSLMAIHCV